MIDFKKIPIDDMPRERLLRYGAQSLSNEELIAIILKTGSKGYNVKEVSLRLLSLLGCIDALRDIGIVSLMKIPGVGKVKAIELKAALELGRRVYTEKKEVKSVFSDAKVVYSYFRNIYFHKKQEEFYCVYLDTKNNFIDKKCLFVGTIDNATVHPREIFKEAYLLSASKIICVHNHPSGDVIPSKADINLTRKIAEIGFIHGIVLIDHIIVGDNNYYSFHENGTI